MWRAAALLALLAGAAQAGDRMEAVLGEALFQRLWVPSPASTRGSDGLGPLMNARSCAGCHPGAGGGAVPGKGLVLKLDDGAGNGDPLYGRQLQDRAAPGLSPEGQMQVQGERPGSAGLVAPVWGAALTDGALALGTVTSVRRAPSLRGLGLLEAVPEAALLAMADPQDLDGDGISGRPGAGRFGWKAVQPDLLAQSAAAFHVDLGLSTPLQPDPAGDCTPAQTACRAAPMGEDAGLRDGREVPGAALALVAAYLRGLPPPPAAAPDPAGLALFTRTGCAACHRAELPGATGTVHAYTDLLLHDMGPDLADDLAEGGAKGSEWRTPPLWGLGGLDKTGRPRHFLHDGRARHLTDAILWHGGEAEAARDAFAVLPDADRARLIAFLESL